MHLALITGGETGEREVSLNSAKNIEELLKTKHTVTVFDFPTDVEKFVSLHKNFDAAIPMIHGKGGEDGVLQGFLETLGVPYIFSGVSSHSVALDKHKTKLIVAKHSITTPQSSLIHRGKAHTYTQHFVVKPVCGGSTVATAIVHSQEELDAALLAAGKVDEWILVEDFVAGDEFTVGVIEEYGQPVALPVIQIKSPGGFFDYQSKYDATKLAEELCPAPISQELTKKLQQLAITAHQALGCRHLSRTDIIVAADGTPYFLETNTIPGMTSTSLVPKAVKVSGRELASLFEAWLGSVVS